MRIQGQVRQHFISFPSVAVEMENVILFRYSHILLLTAVELRRPTGTVRDTYEAPVSILVLTVASTIAEFCHRFPRSLQTRILKCLQATLCAVDRFRVLLYVSACRCIRP